MADRQLPEVVPLGPKEHSRAGEVLGRAFREDPLWVAVMRDAEMRPALLERMFTAFARTIVAAGGVAERTPRLEAVALWLPPGTDLKLWSMVRAGFALPRFTMAMPRSDRARMMHVLRRLGARRKELVPEPHWYLTAIGVEPEQQGRGLGTALVRTGMRRADHDGTPLYLETETRANVAFYEKLGFEVREEIVASGLDVQLWLMLRSPGTPLP